MLEKLAKSIAFVCILVLSSVLHQAKSYMPFELFANENHKLYNEAKINVIFERGSAQDPLA